MGDGAGIVIYLDTHVIVWLHQKRLEEFNDRVRTMLEQEDLQISPAVMLELEYLYEIEKINFSAHQIAGYLEDILGISISLEPFTNVVREACKIKWTRDPFDRLIAAQAGIRKNSLITKDSKIRAFYPDAVW